MPTDLRRFDELPDDAIVTDKFAADLLGVSIWTLRRSCPVPARQISERRKGRRVGDLRKLIRGEKAA